MDFEITGQQLIIYAAFIKCFSKMGIQCGSASAVLVSRQPIKDSVMREVWHNILIMFDTL
jgi:hypothetical protein